MSDAAAGTTPADSPARPVAPVRTRWLESRPADTSGGVLPPTRSSGAPSRRPSRPPTPAPAAPEGPVPPEPVSEPAGDDSMPWDAPQQVEDPIAGTADLMAGAWDIEPVEEPWAEVSPPESAQEDAEVGDEELIEVEIEAVIEIDEDVPEDALDLELVPVDEPEAPLERPPLETRFYDEVPEGAVPVPAPLSAWDFSAVEDEEAAAERSARGRAEWEALGEALAASLGGEDASVFESAMQALAAGIASGEPGDAAPGITREIVEIADRIAYFASQLRSDGYRAITNAQARGDRLEIALAGLAAGFLAGQHE